MVKAAVRAGPDGRPNALSDMEALGPAEAGSGVGHAPGIST